MEILTLLTIKPIVLVMEIVFTIIGRLYESNVGIVLTALVINLIFLPIQFGVYKKIKWIKSLVLGFECILFAGAFAFYNEINPNLLEVSWLRLLPIVILVEEILIFIICKRINYASILVFRLIPACLFVLILFFSPTIMSVFWAIHSVFFLMVNLLCLLVKKARKEGEKREKTEGDKSKEVTVEKVKFNTKMYFLGILFMALFTGLLIPANVISSSPTEFVDVVVVRNPLRYLIYSGLFAFGFFGIFGGAFFLIAKTKIQIVLSRLIWIVCFISAGNYLISGSYWGEMSPTLLYFDYKEYDLKRVVLSIVLMVAFTVIVYLMLEKIPEFFKILVIAQIAVVLLSVIMNMVRIQTQFSKLAYLRNDDNSIEQIRLSKSGKNVVVLILDRALGTDVPYLFAEKEKLREQFDGFTYYPNTVSFGAVTNVGIPSVYGGYEYTPEKINERDSETLASKQDEALKVMPVLFWQNNYQVTVCDPAYAGYQWTPDTSIYDDYKGIRAFNLEGKFSSLMPSDAVSVEELLKRNLFCHSLVKTAPLNWQLFLFNDGNYCNPNYNHMKNSDSVYTGEGYYHEFLDSYLALDNLSSITEIEDSEENNLLLMYNGTPHMPCMLQEPDYVPKKEVDNTEYHLDDLNRFNIDGRILRMENTAQITHYHVNMTTFLSLGKWFDYLKENDCYDNTRIILVADHGKNVHYYDLVLEQDVDAESFMPLLMYKDFDSHGLQVSDEFMTNADTMLLATKGLIDNPKNPFTGNIMDGHEKETDEIKVLRTVKANLEDNQGNKFLPGEWFSVRENPYKLSNWKYLGFY